MAIAFALAACGPEQPSLEEAIIGEWVNAHGGTIHFYDGGSGFIPGDENLTPPVPPVNFTYRVEGQTHISINIAGQDAVIVEIKLEGDRMTWIDATNNLEFAYRRVG